MEYNVRTIKLKIYAFGDNKKETRDRVYQIANDTWKAANYIVTGQYLNDDFIRRIYARKKINPKDNKEAVSKIETEFFSKTGFFETKRQATTDRDHRPIFPNIPPSVSNILNRIIFESYKKEKSDLLMGKKSLRTYKQGMPFPIIKTSISFFEDGDKYGLKWTLNKNERLFFYIYFGRDKAGNKVTIKKIIDGELEYSAAQIQVKKGAFYLLLPVKYNRSKFELDTNLSVGIDLGIATPAYVALSQGLDREAIGSIDDFLRVRLQFQNRKKRMQKSLRSANGGHGRKKKLKAFDSLREKERNFARTYNHMVSRRIIDFAIKHKAGVVKMEMLEGFGKKESQAFVLRNWSFFELQSMLEYKAKMVNIKVIKIDPYHTSQTCSKCGNFEEGQRFGRDFKCKKCGFETNADYNAAVNIAQSTKIVTKKEQCEFYKKAS